MLLAHRHTAGRLDVAGLPLVLGQHLLCLEAVHHVIAFEIWIFTWSGVPFPMKACATGEAVMLLRHGGGAPCTEGVLRAQDSF